MTTFNQEFQELVNATLLDKNQTRKRDDRRREYKGHERVSKKPRFLS